MTHQQSFSRLEHDLLPRYRKLLNEAESTEDVNKIFAYTVEELLGSAVPGLAVRVFEEVRLQPEAEPPYFLQDSIRSQARFRDVWEDSDLPQVLLRFAEGARHRYLHLGKNRQRTEQKIRKLADGYR